MSKYRYDSAYDWLLQKIGQLEGAGAIMSLAGMFRSVLAHSAVDNDMIQDVFQAEMDADGFFEELPAKATDFRWPMEPEPSDFERH